MPEKSTTPVQTGEPFRAADSRPVFHVTFRPKPGVDGHAALRGLLKRALRDQGLVCLAVREGGE